MKPIRQNLTIASIFRGRCFSTSVLTLMLIFAMNPIASCQESNAFTPQPDTELSFPTEPLVFDPSIKAATHELEAGTSTAAVKDTATADSVSQMWNDASTFVQAQWSQGEWSSKINAYFGGADIGRMLGSLAVVLGGYFGFVWLVGLFSKNKNHVPSEVLELLGSVPLSPKKQLKIVRLGSKLLLLIDGEEGTHSIGEISDPNEVEYLSSLCRGKNARHDGVTHKIRQAAQQLAAQSESASQTGTASATGSLSTNETAPPIAAGIKDSHLATLLQALGGSRNGNAAVFEA